MRGPHHTGRRRQAYATAVVANANAKPDYRCPKCGLTRAEGVAKWGDNGEWESGHLIAGQVGGREQAEHIHCNRSDGARIVNARRASGYTW
jgi:hypothetical protein